MSRIEYRTRRIPTSGMVCVTINGPGVQIRQSGNRGAGVAIRIPNNRLVEDKVYAPRSNGELYQSPRSTTVIHLDIDQQAQETPVEVYVPKGTNLRLNTGADLSNLSVNALVAHVPTHSRLRLRHVNATGAAIFLAPGASAAASDAGQAVLNEREQPVLVSIDDSGTPHLVALDGFHPGVTHANETFVAEPAVADLTSAALPSFATSTEALAF